LAGIDFKICSPPGSQISKPDALSRRSEYCSPKVGSEDQPIQTVLQKKNFDSTFNLTITNKEDTEKERVLIAATKLLYKR
jgi:hypothetical protein